jgi:pimeloyl-ACP methyl ester carboxylesterase
VHVPPELATLVTFLGTEGLAQLQTMLTQQRETSETAASGPLSGASFGGVLQTYLAYHLHGDPIAASLGKITVPALILHGTADTEVPFVEAERLQAGLPHATLVPFIGGEHDIMVAHAPAYCQALVTFLHSLKDAG